MGADAENGDGAVVAGVDTTEYENVIHPGAADGSGFWNAHAKWFMYAPAEALMELDAASRSPDGELSLGRE